MPLKYMGSTLIPDFNIDYLASALEYAADNGANVIDISIVNYEHSTTLKDAVDYAYGKGVVLVHPAGNDNTIQKAYPGAYDNVIAVGGTDHNDNRMNWYDEVFGWWVKSNYGPWVDVAAPGELVYSTTPTYHVTYNDYGAEQNYDYGTGTSASGPIVAGVAGLILSKHPSYTPDMIKSLICNNVDPYDSGYYLGSGRVNAHKALLASEPPTSPIIDGETKGDTGKLYEYFFTSTDPNNDNISEYIVNWGDGPDESVAGSFESGEPASASHKWTAAGDYGITVKAVDVNGIAGPEETYSVTMPRTKTSVNHFWLRILDIFPILQGIIELLR
jgi:subtilisin family serine protease